MWVCVSVRVFFAAQSPLFQFDARYVHCVCCRHVYVYCVCKIARLILYIQHKMCENSPKIFFFYVCHKIQYNNFVAAFFRSLFSYNVFVSSFWYCYTPVQLSPRFFSSLVQFVNLSVVPSTNNNNNTKKNQTNQIDNILMVLFCFFGKNCEKQEKFKRSCNNLMCVCASHTKLHN